MGFTRYCRYIKKTEEGKPHKPERQKSMKKKTIVINNELGNELKQRYDAESKTMIKRISEMQRVVAEAKEEKREGKKRIKQDNMLKRRYVEDGNMAKYFV